MKKSAKPSGMLTQHTSYRNFLRETLIERIQRNPSYSLRALARDLEMNPAHLSQILNGIRNISPENALRVARRLELSPSDSDFLWNLVQYENEKNPELKEKFKSRLRDLGQENPVVDLSIEAFRLIADWYHVPILLLVDLKDFRVTPQNIARKLGISSAEAQEAMQRLLRLELIEETGKDAYKRTTHQMLFTSPSPNTALRSFHTQMMERAIRSLKELNPDQRNNGSETFLGLPESLVRAEKIFKELRKKIIDHFAGELEQASEEKQKQAHIYHLEWVLFPIDSKTSKKVKRKDQRK